MSCPKLYNLAYKADNVEQLMDERTRMALNDDTFTQVKSDQSQVSLSKFSNGTKMTLRKRVFPHLIMSINTETTRLLPITK